MHIHLRSVLGKGSGRPLKATIQENRAATLPDIIRAEDTVEEP